MFSAWFWEIMRNETASYESKNLTGIPENCEDVPSVFLKTAFRLVEEYSDK